MHGVYVLLSRADGRLYIGYSRDIKHRLEQHNAGKVSATRKRVPFMLIYCELFCNQADAMRRELYLKTGWGRKYLNRTLTETFKKKNLGG